MDSTTPTKVYKTKFTPKLLAVGILPMGSAAALGYFAMDASAKFAPSDPTKYLFVGVPATICAVIVLGILLVCNHFLNKKITISGKTLTYEDSKITMILDMAEMAYSPPAAKSLLQTIMFSDGATFVQIPQLFLGQKDFEALNKTIKDNRRQSRNEMGPKTYSL